MKPRLDRSLTRRKRTWTFVADAIHTLQRLLGFVAEPRPAQNRDCGFRPRGTSDWCRPFDQLRQRQILSMLAVAEASSASAWAALRPRQENWRRPCLSLRCPLTGSTVTPRRR